MERFFWKIIEKILDVMLFVAYVVIVVYDIYDGRPDAAVAWVCCAAWHTKNVVDTMRRRDEKRTD